MKLSAFDQSPTALGAPPGDAVAQTLALARLCEELGYHRFWVAEHHGNAGLEGTAPEILVSAIAATTRTIRVGSAGVLLRYYSAFKVAEQFRVLEACAPGRIDLGIGRSPGGDAKVAAALAEGVSGAEGEHGDKVRRLLALLDDDVSAQEAVRAYPRNMGSPEAWVLGGSNSGARLAAELGLPFAFNVSNTLFPDGVEGPLALYRSAYKPSARYPEPYLSLQVWALAADTQDEANRLFATRERWRVQMARGERAPMLPPDQAMDLAVTAEEHGMIGEMRAKCVVGSADQVADGLARLVRRHEAQELAINTWTHDPLARQHSYRLIARAFG